MSTTKITLGEIESAMVGLRQLGALDTPVAVSYRVTKLRKALKDDAESYIEARNELLKKFGTEQSDEEGKPNGRYTFEGDSAEKFNEAAETLSKEEATFESRLRIDINSLLDDEELRVKGETLELIYPVMFDSKDEKPKAKRTPKKKTEDDE